MSPQCDWWTPNWPAGSCKKASAYLQSSRHQVESRIILVWLSSLPAAAHHHLHPCNVATMGQPSTALVPPAAANAALSPTTAAAAHTQLLAYLPPARSCCCCRAWQHHAAHMRASARPHRPLPLLSGSRARHTRRSRAGLRSARHSLHGLLNASARQLIAWPPHLMASSLHAGIWLLT